MSELQPQVAASDIELAIKEEDSGSKDSGSKDSGTKDPGTKDTPPEKWQINLPVNNTVGGILVDKRRSQPCSLPCGKYKIVHNTNCWAWFFSVILFLTLFRTLTKGIFELGKPNLSQFSVAYQPYTAQDPKFCQNVGLMTKNKDDIDNTGFGCTNVEGSEISKSLNAVVQMDDPPPMTGVFQDSLDQYGPLDFNMGLYEYKYGLENGVNKNRGTTCEGYEIYLTDGTAEWSVKHDWTDITLGKVDTSFNYKLEKDKCVFWLSEENVKALVSNNTQFEYMAYVDSEERQMVTNIHVINTIDPNKLPHSMYLGTESPRINEQYTIFSFAHKWYTSQQRGHWVDQLCSQRPGYTGDRKCKDNQRFLELGMTKHSFNSPSLLDILDFTGIMSNFWEETQWMYWAFSITYDQQVVQVDHKIVDIDQIQLNFLMGDMIKTDVSYQSLSDLLERVGGLYGALFPILVLGFSLITYKWNNNASMKEKLDDQIIKYLDGQKIIDETTQEEFPETLKQSQDDVIELAKMTETKDKRVSITWQALQKSVIDKITETYEHDINYFGTMQYYFFIDKIQRIQNKVLLIKDKEIKALQDSNKTLKDTVQTLIERVEALEIKSQ